MTRDTYNLRDKVVLVTGGTSGIGAATARELLRRGARVAIVDINSDTADFARQLSPTAAMGAVADVTACDQLDAAVDSVIDRFGRIDVAIANAGILIRAATLRNTPPAAISKLFDVNITGAVNTVQATMEHVIDQRGQFVLLSSVFAFVNGMGTVPYAMSKAAVEQLGRGLRVELAMHGVTTTTAYFSLIETPMIASGVDADPAAGKLLAAALPRPLLRRLRPEDAATALADGLQHRAPRIMRPRRWRPLDATRGVTGPLLDAHLAKHSPTLAALSELDTR